MSHNAPVGKRYDFVFLFDVRDGNPNGNPDAGNMPRTDPHTQQGLVTDVCLKRKVRNAFAVMGEGKPGYDTYLQTQDAVYDNRVLNLVHQRAWDAIGEKPVGAVDDEAAAVTTGDAPVAEVATEPAKKGGRKAKKAVGDPRSDYNNVLKARDWMCSHCSDVRTWGAMMATSVSCGQVRGPVQLTFARSVDAVVPLEISITRKSVTTEEDATKQIGGCGTIVGTMGCKYIVPYALYVCHGFVNPYLAKSTGFNEIDLQMLWAALSGQMWDHDHSSARGMMGTRGLYVFEHASPLGNASAHSLFDRVSVPALGDDKTPRGFGDYKVTVNEKDMPTGVTLHRMVG